MFNVPSFKKIYKEIIYKWLNISNISQQLIVAAEEETRLITVTFSTAKVHLHFFSFIFFYGLCLFSGSLVFSTVTARQARMSLAPPLPPMVPLTLVWLVLSSWPRPQSWCVHVCTHIEVCCSALLPVLWAGDKNVEKRNAWEASGSCDVTHFFHLLTTPMIRKYIRWLLPT